jgi:hypothetical protein
MARSSLGEIKERSIAKVHLTESRQQRFEGRIRQLSDHPKRMVPRHHRLRAHVAEHPIGLTVHSAHI